MGEFEAVGDMVTGGLVGRAVEPKAGEAGPDGHTHETSCLNCGTPLKGDFCHACGQHAHIHRTLKAFGHDLLHGVFHFEGKIWKTLPLLVWKPGELTRRYIEGQRATFVSPIALFLFTVFLTFGVMGLTGALESGRPVVDSKEIATEITRAREKIARLETERVAAVRQGRSTTNVDERLADAQTELAALGLIKGGNIAPVTSKLSKDSPGWLRGFVGEVSANPELVFYKFKTNAYKYSWALIPISVPFMWLLFPFSRRFGVYDHTVFVTYSLCFMMLLLVVGSTIGLLWPTIGTLLFFVPPFHMYRQLKGAYGLGRWGALWRTTLLIGFSFAAAGLFAAAIVGAGEV